MTLGYVRLLHRSASYYGESEGRCDLSKYGVIRASLRRGQIPPAEQCSAFLRADALLAHILLSTSLFALIAIPGRASAQEVIDNQTIKVPGDHASPWIVGGDLIVADLGTAGLIVEQGGSVSSATGHIGLNGGSDGRVTVTGSGSSWIQSGDLRVGTYGSGLLTIDDGGIVSNAFGLLGIHGGSSGTAVVGNGSQWLNSGGLYVGDYGIGALTVRDGGAVSSQEGYIASNAGATGEVTVTGPGSQWTTNLLSVGTAGTGTITAEAGASVDISESTIGFLQGSVGTVNVTDGARLDAAYNQTIGFLGSGTLNIASGGSVTNDSTQVGSQAGSTGSATVSGAGSSWTMSGGFFAGHYGSATVVVADGATLRTAYTFIGTNSGASGAAVISGAGSGWINDGGLYVGLVGTGSLTIGDGALVRSGGGFGVVDMAQNTGSTGTLTIGSATSVPTSAGILEAGEVRFGAGAGTINFNHDNTAYVFSTPVTGAGALNHYAGTTILTANNNYSGATAIQGGTLQLGNGGTTGWIVDSDIVNDGTLAFNRSDDIAYSGTISGSGGIAQLGSGTLTLTGGNSYSGITNIGAGAMAAGAANVLGAGSAVTIATGAVLELNGFNQDVGSVAGGGLLRSSGGTAVLTTGIDGRAALFAGRVESPGSTLNLVKVGAGTLTLSGDNDYSGETVIRGGVLALEGQNHQGTNSYYAGRDGGDDGNLVIRSGGSLDSGTSYIGDALGAVGSAAISGVGSRWTIAGELLVGNGGDATILISSGGSLANDAAQIGQLAGSSGRATVTGAESTWTSSVNLVVGGHGSGALTIADGGTVQVLSGQRRISIATDAGSTGTLNIGSSAGAPAAPGSIDASEIVFGSGAGSINFNHTDTNHVFLPVISGSGTVDQRAGTTTLTGDNSYTGATSLRGGTLRLAGTSSGTGRTAVSGGTLVVDGISRSTTNIQSGGALRGDGRIEAAVAVENGGTLFGAQDRTLTVGSLTLGRSALTKVTLGAPNRAAPALFDVTGDLTLDGVLDISDAGGFGAGVYALFTYGGTLTDNGLAIGVTPSTTPADTLFVQTAIGNQVNLVNSAGADLLFWDGGTAALHDNDRIDGGSGTWSALGRAWTRSDGAINNAMHPQPGLAIFQGSAGTVTVDKREGPVEVTGMQFASDNYLISGDSIGLAAENAIIRVGNGAVSGADYIATIAAALTGSATLVKTDTGTLILGGDNSYTGGTVVQSGTLIGDTSSIQGDIQNDAQLVFDQSFDGTFGGTVSGSGEILKSGAGTLTLAGANDGSWTVEEGRLISTSALFTGNLVVARGASFIFSQAGDGTYQGNFSGEGGLLFSGGGQVMLTGNSSGYAGLITVDEDTLRVDGRLGGALDVLEGARLEGTGTVGTTRVAGAVAPGNSIGALMVDGDLTLSSTAVFEVEVEPQGGSDKLAVSARATIQGGRVLALASGGDYAPATDYLILKAAGGVSGTFDGVTSNLAFLNPSLLYSANDVTLRLARNSVQFVNVGETPNQKAVAPVLESLGSGNPVYDALLTLDADDARLGYDQLSGDGHATLRDNLIKDGRIILDHLVTRREGDGGGAWASTFGYKGEVEGDGNASGHEHVSKGVTAGLEFPVGSNWRLGATYGYGDSDLRGDSGFSGEAKSHHVGMYAAARYHAFSAQLGMIRGWHDLRTDRAIDFPGFTALAKARRSAATTQMFAQVGWRFGTEAMYMEPFAGFAHVRLSDDAFAETGGPAALRIGDENLKRIVASLGLRSGVRTSFGSLYGSAELRHSVNDTMPVADAAFSSGAAFTVAGTQNPRASGLIKAGARVTLGEHATFTLGYSGHMGGRAEDHGAQATLSWGF